MDERNKIVRALKAAADKPEQFTFACDGNVAAYILRLLQADAPRLPAAGGAPSVDEIVYIIDPEVWSLKPWNANWTEVIERRLATARAKAAQILALFPTPPQPTAAGVEENTIGAAEREVGRFIYRRIEVLMNAQPETTEGRELAYLARIVSDVEEYGADGTERDAGSAFFAPTNPERDAARVAIQTVIRCAAYGWRDLDAAKAASEALALLSHLPAPEGEGGHGARAVPLHSNCATYEDAVELVLKDRKASPSYVQRKLQVSWSTADDWMSFMEREGIVTAKNAAGVRQMAGAAPAQAEGEGS